MQDKLDEEIESSLVEKLSLFIEKTNAHNENTIVIVPPIEQISINLDLPFSAPPKHLDKIIKNEVQDMMPLSSEELHVQYQFLKKTKSIGSLPVHVSLLSENIFKNILNVLKKVGIDPFVFTTPAAVLGVVNHLAKDFFKVDSAIVEKWGDFIHILYIQDGVQVHERSLPTVLNNQPVAPENLISQLRIVLRAFEKDIDGKIEFVYYGKNIDAQIAKGIGKESELLDIGQFINCDNENKKERLIFSALSSFLVQDAMPFTLSNFRMGKFDCTVSPKEVFKILKKLLPITIVFILCIFVGIISSYFIREARIKQIYTGIREATKDKVAISENGDLEDIVAELKRARNALEADLSQIASSYTVSPSKIIEILSLDLSTINGLELNSFDFKANNVKIFGTVPSYSDFEKLEKILSRRRNIFKAVNATQSAGRGKLLNFTVTISLED
ncbi:MAG: hypothetical protein ACOX3T_08480 [Bdellovibrionota bacterium]